MVGTPGTVKRWITRDRYLRPQSLRIFVLDEADKMVEEKALGADTLAIRKLLAPTAQILFFSATYTKEIIAYARQIVPKAYLVTPRSTEELVLDVIFQVRMDVRKCKGGKLQVRTYVWVAGCVDDSGGCSGGGCRDKGDVGIGHYRRQGTASTILSLRCRSPVRVFPVFFLLLAAFSAVFFVV